MRPPGTSQKIYENKELIKKCQNVIENAGDRIIFNRWKYEMTPQMPVGNNLTEKE